MKKLVIIASLVLFILSCNPEADNKSNKDQTTPTKDKVEQIDPKIEQIEIEAGELDKSADSLLNSI